MKIMIVSDLAPPIVGGAENYVVNLGSRLAKLGHEVHWVTSKLPDTSSSEVFQGINIHRIPIIYPQKHLFPGRQSFSITSLIPAIKLARKMDVIQVNSLVPGVTGWIIAKFSGKPSLLFCHELYGNLWKRVGQNSLEKHIYPFIEKIMANSPYDWFVCPSQYSKLSLMRQGTPKDKTTVIPHGVEFHSDNNPKDYRFEFKLDGSLTMGYIGRLNIKKTAQAKNIKTLLKATSIISHEIPNLKLVLAGNGFEELTPLIRDLGIQENVVYFGRIPQGEIKNFYEACDVVVCPALSDGFCFLLAEASACGVPTVATNLGSHPERIVHNETGMLSSEEPDDIAKNVIKLLRDKQLSKELGINGISYSKKFTWENSVDEHLKIYRKLIDGKG